MSGSSFVYRFTKRRFTFIIFLFVFFSPDFSIDATKSTGRAGRMINDSTIPNSVMKVVIVENIPRLCVFALRDISPGEEIRFDYGVPDLPWRDRVLFLPYLFYILYIFFLSYFLA